MDTLTIERLCHKELDKLDRVIAEVKEMGGQYGLLDKLESIQEGMNTILEALKHVDD